MEATVFRARRSLRVPGLGLLVVPAAPLPGWLLASALHTPLHLRLHRPGQPTATLQATIEQLEQPGQPAIRALLLDADPAGPVTSQAQLELVEILPAELQ